jgi:hypothetical protein
MEEEGTTRGSYDGKYVVKYSFPKNTLVYIVYFFLYYKISQAVCKLSLRTSSLVYIKDV